MQTTSQVMLQKGFLYHTLSLTHAAIHHIWIILPTNLTDAKVDLQLQIWL